MRLGEYLSSLTTPELEELKELLNLTEDELEAFSMLAKGKTLVEVSMENKTSVSTLKRRIESIKRKVEKLNGKSSA
jgi:DNA-binding NarL/FixJ family response regulator